MQSQVTPMLLLPIEGGTAVHLAGTTVRGSIHLFGDIFNLKAHGLPCGTF